MELLKGMLRPKVVVIELAGSFMLASFVIAGIRSGTIQLGRQAAAPVAEVAVQHESVLAATTGAPEPNPTPTPLASLAANKPVVTAAPAATPAVRLSDAQVLQRIKSTPQGVWVVAGGQDYLRDQVAEAAASPLATLVAYNIPGRDCGNYSVGGANSADSYAQWIDSLADAIGNRALRVVLEPDALGHDCTAVTATPLLAQAVTRLKAAAPNSKLYLDASHWVEAGEMAARLAAAGLGQADGFSLNVSNFQTTASMEAYGRAVSAASGGKHFIIDVSRNGNGPKGSEWCNPDGRAAGAAPSLGRGLVDGYLWLKRPGESDGTCAGGPAAGVWWPAYAIGLGRAAGW